MRVKTFALAAAPLFMNPAGMALVVTWTPLLTAHASAAGACLVLGAFNLLRQPRGDGLHPLVGSTWTALMYWVCLSSFWIRELVPGQFSWIHLLSVLTLVTLSLGLYFGIRRNVRRHRSMMRGTYLGLVGAFVGAVALPQRALPRLAVEDPLRLGVVTVAVVVAALGTLFAHRHGGPRLDRAASSRRPVAPSKTADKRLSGRP